jgi:thiol:disulfide interchange protein DsbD
MKVLHHRLLQLLVRSLVVMAGALPIGAPTIHAKEASASGSFVSASLIAETEGILPDQPLHIALRQKIRPGWHTYWQNPGDAGLPTTIERTLPPGFAAKQPINAPQRHRTALGLYTTPNSLPSLTK